MTVIIIITPRPGNSLVGQESKTYSTDTMTPEDLAKVIEILSAEMHKTTPEISHGNE